ncbi:electron transport complex subunit RsxG [Pontibacter sp. JAM-7]|uniref:electron transport complex subunit RsxG n=1 Tax=Pontibacter sp. JAM-7 TaxID=3366581 RepID=UPI003AF8A59E
MQLLTSLRNSSLALTLFAVVTAALIAVTQVTTEQRIANNEREQQARALYEIIPKQRVSNDLLSSGFEFVSYELTGSAEPATGYRALQGDDVIAVILPAVAPDGYNGRINLIVGINADGSVAGVRVLGHQETPGLGDKIELKKSDWILSFNGTRKADNPNAWGVIKDGGQFDQFTGATITPRAVVKAVGYVQDYFAYNRASLLELADTEHRDATRQEPN